MPKGGSQALMPARQLQHFLNISRRYASSDAPTLALCKTMAFVVAEQIVGELLLRVRVDHDRDRDDVAHRRS